MRGAIRGGCLLALLLSLVPTHGASLMPAADMAALQEASEEAGAAKPGSAEQRRACKRVVRAGNALLTSHPDDPNTFQLLGLMLQNQKMVLQLEQNDRNRAVLYDICSQLALAPDDWAEDRLEADLLLSERDLSAGNASLQERAEALTALIQRYRGTAAEAKSLMIGAVIAKELESPELQRFIEQSMDERCADIPEVIVFRRKVLSLKALRVKCKGRYTRSDGADLYIPGDRIGHQCLLVYWSQADTNSERFLQQVKEQQEKFPGAFEVYSFNLDELPDAGEKMLRDKGLDWHAMHLPDGKRNVAYQAYGAGSPVALFVNAFGYTVLNPFGVSPDSYVGVMGLDGGVFKVSESRLSHPRYLAQLQSLFIGDFLVWETGAPPASISPAFQAIQQCFVPPPYRYRLTREQALENYQKAEKLCSAALKQHPDAPESGLIRNRRIIALLGMWNLLCDPAYFEQATREARIVLASNGPPAASMVARFCLAKEVLRRETAAPELDIQKMVEEAGGDEAPELAVAAASILSLEANRRTLHEAYRSELLERTTPHSQGWVRSFLLDRYHRFYLLKPNSTRGDRMGSTRYHIVNHEWNPDAPPFPNYALKNLDGSSLSLPDDTKGKLTLLLFVEPPSDPTADFPVVLDRKGNPTKNDHIRSLVDRALDLAGKHVNKEVEVLLTFLTDDSTQVQSLMTKNDWTCRAALVPGGLKAPLVRQLGILSADRLPNVFLLRRDGAVAWSCSGFVYKSEFGFPFAVTLAMKVHIEVADVQLAYRTLTKKDFSNAARIFDGPFRPFEPDRYGWRSPRHHGRALAQMGLKEWEAALESIDKAIDAHKLDYHSKGFRSRHRIEDWRKNAAEIPLETSCDIFTELWITKALILQQLDQTKEAASFRKRAETSSTPDASSLYTEFHHQLRAFRQGIKW